MRPWSRGLSSLILRTGRTALARLCTRAVGCVTAPAPRPPPAFPLWAGTILARASVTGGIVLQACARAHLTRAAVERRLPWSHYTAQPGVIEVTGRSSGHDLAAGFLREPVRPPGHLQRAATLDIGSVAGRLLSRVQRMPHLDRVTMLRARRTRLRFAVTWRSPETIGLEESPAVDIEFVLHDESLRTLRLRLPPQLHDPAEVVVACEDLALHDWLLSTVSALLENSLIGVDPAAEVVARIRPAIDHLLHLWMPGGRVAESLGEMWTALEVRPGFSRQWASLRGQIQNQMLLSILEKPPTASAAGLLLKDGSDALSREV